MAPFIGPARDAAGDLLLVGALAGRGYPLARHKQRTRMVVDDFGNAVMYQRRCPDCLRWLPLSFDHFAPRNDDLAQGMDGRCLVCCRVNGALRRERDPERARRLARERYRHKAAADPEWARARNRRSREAAERRRALDPEGWRKQRQAGQKRRWARVKADPERHAALMEKQRMDARLRRERREGITLNEIRRRRAKRTVPDRAVTMPALQLALAIDGAAAREAGPVDENNHGGRLAAVCLRCELNERTVWAWRTGERPRVELAVADRVLVALELLWWDIWNEETVRKPLVAVTLRRPHRKRDRRGHDVVIWDRGERGYGDAGPDHTTLDAVRDAWEGDPQEATAA